MWGENSWITQCLSFFYFTIFSKPFDILFSVFSNLLGFSVHNLHQTLIFFPYVSSANKVWRELSINDIIDFPNYFPILSLFFYQFTVYDRNHYFGLVPIPKPKPKLANTFSRYLNRYNFNGKILLLMVLFGIFPL